MSRYQLSIEWSQISIYWVRYHIASKLNLQPSNLQLMPWNFQIQYSYLLNIFINMHKSQLTKKLCKLHTNINGESQTPYNSTIKSFFSNAISLASSLMLFNAASLPSSEWNVLMATSTWKQNLTFKYNNYHQKYMIEFNVPDVSFTKCNTWYSAELLDKIYTWIPFELLFFVNTLTSNDIPYEDMSGKLSIIFDCPIGKIV